VVALLDSPVVCGFDSSERDAESSSLILEHADVSPDLLRVVAAEKQTRTARRGIGLQHKRL